MRLAGVKYSQILENTESKDFKNLARTLQETVSSDTSPRVSFFFSVIFLACFDLLWTDRPFCHRLAYQLFSISEILLKMPHNVRERAAWCLGRYLSVCVDFLILDQIRSEHQQTMKLLHSCAPTLSSGDLPVAVTLQHVSYSANCSWTVPLLPPAVLECVQTQVHRKQSGLWCESTTGVRPVSVLNLNANQIFLVPSFMDKSNNNEFTFIKEYHMAF